MLKKILLGVLAIFLLFVAYGAYQFFFVPPASPKGESSFSENGLELSVNYGRPYKKGRVIFGPANEDPEADGPLQAYGKYWRLGANAATELTVNKDFTFAGEAMEAGTYRMFVFPQADSWEFRLNSETGVFLAFREPDYSKDVLKVTVPIATDRSVVEQLTIGFGSDSTGVSMNVEWDNILAKVPIAVQ